MWSTLLFVALAGGVAADAPPQLDARDFFVYACTREYRRLHDIPQYDGSLAVAVEYVDADPALLD